MSAQEESIAELKSIDGSCSLEGGNGALGLIQFFNGLVVLIKKGR